MERTSCSMVFLHHSCVARDQEFLYLQDGQQHYLHFIICVVAHLRNHFFTKSETCVLVAMLVGLLDASCRINVPKVQGPSIFPVCLHEFHVRVGSSTTAKSVITIQFCRSLSRVVAVVARSDESAFVRPAIETGSFASIFSTSKLSDTSGSITIIR